MICVKTALLTAGTSSSALKQDGVIMNVYAFVPDVMQTNCVNYVVLSAGEYYPFDFSHIDPLVMSEAVGAGFILSYGLVALAWGGRFIIYSIMGKKL
ncbi:hypothetical protein [Methylobacter tundripaludum]|uniref:Uncharacterized protein n=1 Tax=Methylobacter tundripaludum (strain ATCC BAA-1195 / DSM 17260 / SV96) TaxID=697282 RepID=G3IYS9_METTV|nr:hypothetical protein [Methylobacter tundripaludum]EGW21230.1 hypothetical protein Mettu_4395 [Methylobacter tundripaludum SV96]